MKNIMDLLLEADESKIVKPSKDVEITRLTKVLGEKVVFTCEAVLIDKYEELKEQATKVDGDEEKLNLVDLQVFMVLEGVKSPNLRSEELRKKYKAATPKELVRTLLLPGEIRRVYETISDLSGFGDNAVQEIKN